MFSLPKFVRVGPSRVGAPDVSFPFPSFSVAFSLGDDPRDPLFSMRSSKSGPDGVIPSFDVPLSRDLLAVCGQFRLILFSGERSVVGISGVQHLADQSLRLEQVVAISGGFTLETRVELFPSGSVVVRKEECAISDCVLCLPRLPGRRQCFDCGGAGRATCVACLGDSETACPACEGRGYAVASVVVSGITALATSAPVFQRMSCGECHGEGHFRCPVCDGLSSARCAGCAGEGHIRCRCRKSDFAISMHV